MRVKVKVAKQRKKTQRVKKGWKETHNQYGTSRVRTYYMEAEDD